MGELSKNHRAATTDVVSVIGTDRSVFQLDIRGDGANLQASALRDHEMVRDVESLSSHERRVVCLAEVDDAPIVSAASESLTPIQFPIQLRDGRASLQVLASHQRLSTLGDALDAAGLSWTVDWIQQTTHAEPLLTDRQRRVLQGALERGLYDTPRTCTVTELADDLDIAKSTCSGTLHRAESAVIQTYFEDHPSLDQPETEETVRQEPAIEYSLSD